MRRLFELIAKSIVFAAAGIVVFFIAIFIGYLTLILISFLHGSTLKPDGPNIETEYVFNFGDTRSVWIHDESSQIVRSWGGSPDSITFEYGVRTIRFIEPAILKTAVDSIEPRPDRVKYKGYMGIFTDGTEFTVDDKGIVHEVE